MQNGSNGSHGVNGGEGGDTTAPNLTKSKSSPKKKKSKTSGESSSSRLQRIRQKSEFIPSPAEEYAREEPLVRENKAKIASPVRRRHASSGNLGEKSKRAERTTRRASCMTLGNNGSRKPTSKISSSGSKNQEKTSAGESSAGKLGRRKSDSKFSTLQKRTLGNSDMERKKREGTVSMRKERTLGSADAVVRQRERGDTASMWKERTVGILDTDVMKKKKKSDGAASMRKERTVGILDTDIMNREKRNNGTVSMRKERTVGILDTDIINKDKKNDGTVSMRKERAVGIPGVEIKQRKRDGIASSRKERTTGRSTRKERTININEDVPPSLLTMQDRDDLPPSLMTMKDNSEKLATSKKSKLVKKKRKSLDGKKKKNSASPSGTSLSPPTSPSTRTRSTVKSSEAVLQPTQPLPSSLDRETTMSSTSTMDTAAETAVSDFDYLSVTGPINMLANEADVLDDTCHGDGDDLVDLSAYNQQGVLVAKKKRKEGLMVWFGDRPRVTEYIVKDKREVSTKWYRKCDLDQLMEHELRINMLQAGGKKMAQYCCQRGLEAQLLEKQMAHRSGNDSCPFQTKKERQAAHVRWVLSLQEALKNYVPAPKGSTSLPASEVESEAEAKPSEKDNRVEILRRKCRSKTKDDRKIAYRYALQDAKESQQIREQDAEFDRSKAHLVATEASTNSMPLFGSMTSSMRNRTNSQQRDNDADPRANMSDSMRSFRSSFPFRPNSNEKPQAANLSKSSLLRSSAPASTNAANIANPMATGGNGQQTNVSMLSRLSIRIKPMNSS